MTDPNIPEWSADPSAYAVEHRRNADGSLEALSVVSKATPTLLFASYTARDGEDTGLNRILTLAKEEERTDPYADHLPSDLAIIRAALRDCDIEPVEAETVDMLLHDALIVVKVDDGDPETMTGAEFVAANPDSRDEIAGLCAGEVDEVRLGGGAAPLVVVTLWPEGAPEPAEALRQIAAFPTDPANRDLTHGAAVDAMADIARRALAILDGMNHLDGAEERERADVADALPEALERMREEAAGLRALLRQAVQEWPQFDAPAHIEAPVNGGDMVEWFGEWRARVQQALDMEPEPYTGDDDTDEDALGRGLEPAEKPDCQPSNPDECPVCRGGRCRGEPS